MGTTCYSHGGTERYKNSSCCCGRRKKTEGQVETEMGRWCDGRCQEVWEERDWRNVARNRDSWQKLLKKVLAQRGLLCQWWWWWWCRPLWLKTFIWTCGSFWMVTKIQVFWISGSNCVRFLFVKLGGVQFTKERTHKREEMFAGSLDAAARLTFRRQMSTTVDVPHR